MALHNSNVLVLYYSFQLEDNPDSLSIPPCKDPEIFVRGGPTLMGFFGFLFCFVRGGIKKPLLAGHDRPVSETPFKWRFAGMPMTARHWMLAW